jgi:tetratricopeptide (TPR) repeat protein
MLASAFGLLALWTALGPRPRTGWSALWLALGLLSKISAVAYVAPILLAGGSLRRQLPIWVVAACGTALLLASRLGPAAGGDVEIGRALLIPDGLALYLHVLVVPTATSLFHALEQLGDGLGWGTVPGAIAVVGLLGLAPSRSRRVAGALLAASALVYLPNVVFRSGVSPVADRYLYEPLAALVWLVATASVAPGIRVAGALACVATLALLVPLNVARQRTWADPRAIWADAAGKYAESPFPWLQLGVAQEALGDLAGAERSYRTHVTRNVESAIGFNNLARVVSRGGRGEEALTLLDRAVALDPEIGPVWFNRGEVLMELGRPEAALEAFRHAVALDPTLAEAHNALGVLLMARGHTEEARVAFEAAIGARPDRPNAHYNLGWLLSRQGQPERAEGHYREAIRLDPGYKRAKNNLALIYMQKGRIREAVSLLESALEVDPEFEDARVNLGTAHLKAARDAWAEVLRLNPERRGIALRLERLQASGLVRTEDAEGGRRDAGENRTDAP